MPETSLKKRHRKPRETLQELRAASLARWKINAGPLPFEYDMALGSTALDLVGIGGMPSLPQP